jgi:hypothetical protein
MNPFHEAVLCAAALLILGTSILSNLSRLAQFDQDSGLTLKLWFHKLLGEKSFLNRQLWPIENRGSLRSSRIGLRIAGVGFLFVGFALLLLAFVGLR